MKKYLAITGVLLILAIVTLVLVKKENLTVASQKTFPELAEMIESRNYAAGELVTEIGIPAIATIEKFQNHPNREVRILTVKLLDTLGKKQCADTLIFFLKDDDAQVRHSALAAFKDIPLNLSHANQLFNIFDQSGDAILKKQIPMLISGIENFQDLKELEQRLDQVNDEQVKIGFIIGLSKLGQQTAQQQFISLLKNSKQETSSYKKDDLFGFVKFIHQKWLLKPLGEMLEDSSILRSMGAHGREKNIRVLDESINLIASISQKTFSFETKPSNNYTPEQIQEVLNYVKSL